jgi:hypothetical protein
MTENPTPVESTPPPEPMQQETPAPQTQEKTDRYKITIIALTMLTTIVAAIVAGLQADANIRANNFNRDSQYYAVLISSELQRVGLQSNYDISTMTEYLRESQTSLVMELTSLELSESGDKNAASFSELTALGAQARADKARSFSVFFSDPRYAPTSPDGYPNMDAYLTDSYKRINELTEIQNAAADGYNAWNSKADTYVSILTVLAISFFMFGLAQALRERMRLTFIIFGVVALLVSMFWTTATLIF